jgi:hypothetical protein
MMWQAAKRVDLAAHVATFDAAGMSKPRGASLEVRCMRRAPKWRSPGVSWRNG